VLLIVAHGTALLRARRLVSAPTIGHHMAGAHAPSFMSQSTLSPRTPDLCGHAVDDRYLLQAVIGEGSFGRVYRGHDRRLARPVAVKVIKPWWSEDPEWVTRFEREAQLMARVSDPGIVQIYDVGQADEGLYYVAELVDGESLETALRRGPLAISEAWEIAEQLCRALAHAHARRVVHGDIKPANVLMSQLGSVKVGDFGVARLAEGSSAGAAATIAGTPKYMAPEQARGRGTTTASDVYSVGVVMYEMLAGRPPFSGTSVVDLALAHLQDPPPPLPSDVPEPLVDVVSRALAKDPRDRYADGEEMCAAVGAARRARPAAPRSRHAPAAAGDRAEAGGARATADAPRGGATRTRVAPRFSRRQNVNPAARRRSVALLAAVIALVGGLVAAAIVIGGVRHVRVPKLHGLSRNAAFRRAHRDHLTAAFHARFSEARKGTVIGQSPSPGTRVRQGSTISVELSKGPPPVALPRLIGSSSSSAQAAVHKLRLHATVTLVPAPGVTPGTVTGQDPTPSTKLFPGATVTLSVAETPRWRTLTTFTGGASVPFRIRGTKWRLVYKMSYGGTCTFIFVCSGPTARAANLTRGTSAGSFDLNEGSGQIWTFPTGPGLYQVRISPGSDSATWSAQVQDWY
jgi:eukaryotic-like serine/threonine-protein kinase